MQYRLAVDYGPDTPRVEGDGVVRERRQNLDTPRAVWATFRIHQKLSRSELMANVNSGLRAQYSWSSVKDYLRRVLLPGGYVKNLNPMSHVAEYMLIESTGPRAPIWRKGGIWDANLDKFIEPRRCDMRVGND